MIGTSRFVGYTFKQLSYEYELKITSTNLDKNKKVCKIYSKRNNNELKAFIELDNKYLKQLKFIKEVEEQECFDIASLCSAVLHIAVIF